MFIEDLDNLPSDVDISTINGGILMPRAMADIRITEKDVLDILIKWDITKAVGPDDISPHFLKLAAPDLCKPLAKLYNMSLETGILPEDWTNIVLVFKQGTKSDPANYRPISLTGIVIKILEKIVCHKVSSYLSLYNIITDSQHGFLEKRSCETQLLETTHDWSVSLDNGCNIYVAFLDFRRV